MRTTFWGLLLIVCLFGGKAYAQQYQDGILTGFETVDLGTNCRTFGQTSQPMTADGNATTTLHTHCADQQTIHYFIAVSRIQLILEPEVSYGKSLVAAWIKKDSLYGVLYGLLPNTPLQVRSDGPSLIVKSGKKESRYRIIAMKAEPR